MKEGKMVSFPKITVLLCLLFFTSKAFPSEVKILTSEDPLHRVEIFLEKPAEKVSKLLVFLHGADTNKGLHSISKDWFDFWLKKGYAVAAVSLPGYGASTGPRDWCGPFTIKTLHFALDEIKKEMGVLDFGVIGMGHGATAALLAASEREDILCIVSANGAYDLLKHLQPDDRFSKTLIAKNYALEVNEEAFRIRSPKERISSLDTPVYIVYREGNPVISFDEVRGFAQSMKEAGKECLFLMKKKTPELDEQKLSSEETCPEIEEWVDHYFE